MKSVEERLHYKDVDPKSTVEKIRSILSQNGIEVEEEWKEPDEIIDTYTVRVTIKGTTVGSNGKGVNREYTRASGYAELIERIQNDILLTDCFVGKEDGIDFVLDPDEVKKTSKEIVEENCSFVEHYFKCVNFDDKNDDEKAEHFRDTHKIDYIRCDNEDVFLTTPFYSLKYNKLSYLPSFAYRCCYGSNGMAAGNTREEAIIQGLSEIIERYVQFLVFKNNISFPDIPLEYLDRYPYIKEMYLKLEKIEGFKFILKDCSLGGKYPVAALIGIEKNTGRYGIKFGCHPDFGIAMERTFTEATQGRKIYEYTSCSVFDFFNENVYTTENIVNTCKVGKGMYPFQIFNSPATYEFTGMPDVSEKSNKEIVKIMINDLLNEGYDVLVRDVSCMGFPSYHIIVPGMSEIKQCSDAMFRVYNTQCYIVKKLNFVDLLTEDDCKYITSVIKYYANSYLENDLHRYFVGVNPEYEFPGDKGFSSALFFASMCNIFAEDYEKANYFMKCLIKTAEVNGADMKSIEIQGYIAIKYYLDGMLTIGKHDAVVEYMKLLFEEKIVDKIDSLFSNHKEILKKIYGNIPKNSSEITTIKLNAKRNIAKARQNNVIDQTKIATILT